MLSDVDIIRAVKNSYLEISPFNRLMIQPNSVDLRLDNEFLTFNNHLYDAIDPSIEQQDLTSRVTIDQETPFILHPGEFVLGSTYENVGLNFLLTAQLHGRSSLGRLGLQVHSTAGMIDVGFSGQITLELSNVANLPIKLYYGMKIAQMCIFKLDSMASIQYGNQYLKSNYQNQKGPVASRSWKNWSIILDKKEDK